VLNPASIPLNSSSRALDRKMPRATQADRKAGKKPKVEDDEPVQGLSGYHIREKAKKWFTGSVLAQFGLQLPTIVKDGVEEVKNSRSGSVKKSVEVKPPEEGKEAAPEAAEKEVSNEGEAAEKEPLVEGEATEKVAEVPKDPSEILKVLQERLTPVSPLGLSEPMTKEALLALKEKELDWGPRSKRTGSPAKERIMVNFHDNMLAYLHILLCLMTLRAFFLRSWFSSLPWLLGYQYLSLVVPLNGSDKVSGPLAKIPIPWEKVPLELCPVQLRVALTFVINALIWFFFLYEVVLCTNWFEKIPIAGAFAYHAYVYRPEAL